MYQEAERRISQINEEVDETLECVYDRRSSLFQTPNAIIRFMRSTIWKLTRRDVTCVFLFCSIVYSAAFHTRQQPVCAVQNDDGDAILNGNRCILSNDAADDCSTVLSHIIARKEEVKPFTLCYFFNEWKRINDWYYIEKVLGKGSYGSVFQVQKYVAPDWMSAPEEFVKEQYVQKLQTNSAKMTDSWKRAPLVALKFESGTLQYCQRQDEYYWYRDLHEITKTTPQPGDYYRDLIRGVPIRAFTLELFEYGSLFNLLRGPFRRNFNVLWMMKDLGKQVEQMYKHQLVQLDIKPQNILVSWSESDGRMHYTLSDFGFTWSLYDVRENFWGAAWCNVLDADIYLDIRQSININDYTIVNFINNQEYLQFAAITKVAFYALNQMRQNQEFGGLDHYVSRETKERKNSLITRIAKHIFEDDQRHEVDKSLMMIYLDLTELSKPKPYQSTFNSEKILKQMNSLQKAYPGYDYSYKF